MSFRKFAADLLGGWKALWDGPSAPWITFLLFELLALGRLWDWHDLPQGDTAGYFHDASRWALFGKLPLEATVFSPLYVVFFGAIQWCFSDPCAAVLAHRYIIVLSTGFLALLLCRRLLPHPWSWIAAACWFLCPHNYNAYFEVHLFGFALTLAACWLFGGKTSWLKGLGIAAALALALLMRNEYLPMPLCLFGVALWELISRKRSGEIERSKLRELWGLFTPSVLLCALWIFLVPLEKPLTRKSLLSLFKWRTEANISQVYAYGYMQRHPEWTGEPWNGGGPLLIEKFGSQDVTFLTAFQRNPSAMIEHFVWNLRLIPSGLELGLFNGYAGRVSPDFNEKRSYGGHPLAAVGLCITLSLAGLALWNTLNHRSALFHQAGWSWLALSACMPSVCTAILTQRPRPSYIFPLTFLLAILAWNGLRFICTRWNLCRLCPFSIIAPGFLLLALAQASRASTSRQMIRDVRNLLPYRELLCSKDCYFASNLASARDIYFYAAPGCRARAVADYAAIHSAIQKGATPEEALDNAGVTTLFLREPDAAPSAEMNSLESYAPKTWEEIASSHAPGNHWRLLQRPSRQKPETQEAP